MACLNQSYSALLVRIDRASTAISFIGRIYFEVATSHDAFEQDELYLQNIFSRQIRKRLTTQRGLLASMKERVPGLITGAADDDPSGISTQRWPTLLDICILVVAVFTVNEVRQRDR